MPIPPFTRDGLLPEGIHECSWTELESRFGTFQGSDRRPVLWAKFREFAREVMASGLIEAMLVDGSFVTAKAAPGDIDLVPVVRLDANLDADLRPGQYNVLSKRRVHQRWGFDIVLARAGTDEVTETADFFCQVRAQPHLRKGILRLRL